MQDSFTPVNDSIALSPQLPTTTLTPAVPSRDRLEELVDEFLTEWVAALFATGRREREVRR